MKKIFKVVFLGNSGAGKTAIFNKLKGNAFNPDAVTTIGMDFQPLKSTVPLKEHAIQLWDTAGQERFETLGQHYSRNANLILVVCDLTELCAANVEIADAYKKYFSRKLNAIVTQNPKTNIIVIGNKLDLLEQEQIAKAENILSTLAAHIEKDAEYSLTQILVSAKENTNIDLLHGFISTAASVHEEISKEDLSADNVNDTIRLGDSPITSQRTRLGRRCC